MQIEKFYLLDEGTEVAVKLAGKWRAGKVVDEPKNRPRGGREVELEGGSRIRITDPTDVEASS